MVLDKLFVIIVKYINDFQCFRVIINLLACYVKN